jgi:hypothetical protein
MKSPFCLSAYLTYPINLWMIKPNFLKRGTYIMTPKLISTSYFINPSHHSVCMHNPFTFARQRIGKYLPATKELLETSSSVRFVSYEGRICGSVYSPIVARQRLAKHVPTATNTCWMCRFPWDPCRIEVKQAIGSSHSSLYNARCLGSGRRGRSPREVEPALRHVKRMTH